jgi:hypothetical protein
MNSWTEFLSLVLNVFFMTFIFAFAFRYYYPSKKTLIDAAYKYVLLEMAICKNRPFEIVPWILANRLRYYIRGIDKTNCKEIIDIVLQKLVDRNILYLVPGISLDIYREVS